MRKKILFFFLLCLFGLVAAGSARADSIYYLTEGFKSLSTAPASTLCGGTDCFGKVDVSLVTGGAKVTVTLTSGVDFVSTGSHETFAFNMPSTFTLSDISLPSGWTDGTSGTESGFGTFSLFYQCGSNCTPPGKSTLDTITFTVAGASLNSFITIMGAGDTGEGDTTFAADIINKNFSGNPTGVVGDDGKTKVTTPIVPEPPSLLLMGTGLALLAGALKRGLLA
jgi:hypothetical protein